MPEPQGVAIERVERNPENPNEVVITFSYATEVGTLRLFVNDDGVVLGINETLSLGDLSHEFPSELVGVDDAEHGYTTVELLAVADVPATT